MKKLDIMIMMSYLDTCFKEDLTMVLGVDGNNHSSRVLGKLKSDGLIKEYSVLKLGMSNKTTQVLKITDEGRTYISDYYHTNIYAHMKKRTSAQFNTQDLKKFTRGLANNRITLFMHAANIASLPYEKPSLYNLVHYYNNGNDLPAFSPRLSQGNFYNNNLDIPSLLPHGIYYSLKEIIEVYPHINISSDNDIFSTSRVRGILFTPNRITFIYLPKIYQNRIIKIVKEVEDRLIQSFKKNFSSIVKQEDSYYNNIEFNALAITNSNSLIPNMVFGGSNGHNTHIRQNTITQKGIDKLSFLNGTCTLYDDIVIFPHTLAGRAALEYYVTHDREEWVKDSYAIFDNLDNFTSLYEDAPNKYIVGIYGNNQSAIFIPYYSVKQLLFLHNYFEDVAIVTYPDMAETLSHAIRRKSLFFDLAGNSIQVNLYRKDGYPIDHIDNDVKRRRVKYKPLVVGLNEDEIKTIKMYANIKGKSKAALIRPYIREALENLADEYSDSKLKGNSPILIDNDISLEDNILELEVDTLEFEDNTIEIEDIEYVK